MPHYDDIYHQNFISILYNELNDNHLQLVSREFYRQKIKEMNISFCRLGEEECELCLTYEAHTYESRKVQFANVMEDITSYVIRSEHQQVGWIIDKEAVSNKCELYHDWEEHIYYYMQSCVERSTKESVILSHLKIQRRIIVLQICKK